MIKDAELYEVGLLIKPELSEVEASAELGNVRSIIEKHNSIVESTTDPKLRKLSYPIQKHSQAYFAALRFSSSPATINGIEQEIKSNTHVLRHLVLSWTHTPTRSILRRRTPVPRPDIVHGTTPITRSEDKPAEKVDEQELDKKLDEILGK